MKMSLLNDEVNLVWITDIHLSALGPGRRSDEYRVQIFDKLRQVAKISRDNKAVCLVGGDVFHIKNPHAKANTHALIREAVEVFGSFHGGCVYGCVGNHDIQFDRMDTLLSQPLGVLMEAGVYRALNGDPLIIEVNEEEKAWKILVETWDFQDQEETYLALKNSGKRPDDVEYRLGIVHASGCTGDTRDFFDSPIIGYNQLKELDFDILLWGHDHTRTETEQCGNVTHINLGSLARAALSMDEADRPVSAVLIRLRPEGAKIKEIPLKILPLEQAFRTEDKKILQMAGSADMKEFFADLSESVEEIESTDPITVIDALCKDDQKLCSHVKEACNL